MASSSASAISSARSNLPQIIRTLTNHEARRLLLARQGLCGPPAGSLADLIEALGYVQLDSIRVVERAHHHIIHARRPTHRPCALERLHARERLVFEHWTHDASLIPIAYYPHWRHSFADHRTRIGESPRWAERMGGPETAKRVRKLVEREGAIRARDIESATGRTGPWWGWSREKAALEFLWFTGELAILGRDGFEKIYDLAERVIPEAHRCAHPTREETIAWACGGALSRLGAASLGDISDFWDLASRQEVAAWAQTETRAGRLLEVGIHGIDGKTRPALARPQLLDEIDRLPAPPGRARLLSPFDPIVRNRTRTSRLFGFDYRIEVFTPAAKRRYGYYVFPLLEGDRFTGRMDLKADRDRDRLIVKGLWLEPSVTLSKGRRARIEAELGRQARLAAVGALEWPKDALRASQAPGHSPPGP
jgi:hypothetical protein